MITDTPELLYKVKKSQTDFTVEITKSKLTAVEWLFEQISNSQYYYKLIEDIESKGTIRKPKNIFQQAKEMEDQQLRENWKGNSEV